MNRNWLVFILSGACLAQVPVISPRRVLNAHSMQPAPAVVPQGGVLRIEGINLGPAEGAQPSGMPLPTTLSSPEVQVMLNNRAAPIFSVQPDHVIVQIPFDMPQGLAQVIVRRGEQRSRPATVQINPLSPSVKTAAGTGFGEAGVRDGSKLKLAVSGLGPTDPVVPNGDLPTGEAKPRQAIRAYIGGLSAPVEAKLSTERVGEFDVTLDVPEGALPGDLISIYAGQAAPANRPVFERIRTPQVQYMALGNGAQAVRVVRPSDLRGNFAVAHGARGEDGCYPAWIADLGRRRVSRLSECLIAAQANAASPVIAPVEQNLLLSMVGPAVGEVATGVANKLAIFNPELAEPLVVETPRSFSNVAVLPDGTVLGVQGGQPVFSVNPQTGEVGPPPVIGGPGGGGLPGGGQGGAGGVLQTVDLGDGLKEILFSAGVGGGQQFAVVADSPATPTKAKFAIVSNQGTVQSTLELPNGWLPAIRPVQQAQPGQPGGGGVIIPPGGAGGAAGIQARRGVAVVSTGPNQVLILAKRGDTTGVIFVTVPAMQATVVETPAGWFAAACTLQLNFQNFETTRQFALFGARSPQAETSAVCNANGYLVINPAEQTMQAVAFPRAGSANLRVQPAGNADMNDFLYVANSSTATPQLFETIYVLDSLSATPAALSPEGMRGVTLQGQQYRAPELSALVGLGFNQAAGDGGLVYFDLENQTTSVFPVPAGFQSMSLVGIFPSTRKLVALGTKENASGTQLLVFDLLNNDLTEVPLPNGIAFVGALPAAAPAGGGGGAPGGGGGPPGGGGGAPGGGGQGAGGQQQPTIFLSANVKGNTVTAVCFNANRQAVGVMTALIP